MLNRISHTFIHVLDQDEALDFYVGKLGMVINTDADLGAMRWLTVTFPAQPHAHARPNPQRARTSKSFRSLLAPSCCPLPPFPRGRVMAAGDGGWGCSRPVLLLLMLPRCPAMGGCVSVEPILRGYRGAH